MKPQATSDVPLHILQIAVSASQVDVGSALMKAFGRDKRPSGSASMSRPMLRFRASARRPTTATGMPSNFRCLRSSFTAASTGM